ncbi:hypothetical protein P280DRAFT_493609 [Massarina eburnea CBS 473.64]|uniref:T6SS Phospholipase effector Tle1-like catalytic domain-containing protein n=1 Tax=Massarina eburnea CBS 473.64 TaxID=1395130 RepID=A0A6A6RKE0_9PLEO|nr:hypothetical protein P280DRAFT_493609 [Massarina eburnea CBS 473.64]
MAPTPPRHLVIFCDGTWIGHETEISGAPKSNIRLLAEMVGTIQFPTTSSEATANPTLVHRISTRNKDDGTTASSISSECISIYRFIVEHFTSAHSIHLFGFSRGAFSIRCVAGMINNCGILKRSAVVDGRDVDALCEEVYRTYRSPLAVDHPKSQRCREMRSGGNVWQVRRPVAFMGLIDTVGALGIPRFEAGIGLAFPDVELHDQICPGVVRNVFHAVSLHDRLWAFQPCLIFPSTEEHGSRDHADVKRNTTKETAITQIWFPGTHYDLGRQAYRFLRQRPWDRVEAWLGMIPNMLSKTIWPNQVLSDLVLRELLKAVKEADYENDETHDDNVPVNTQQTENKDDGRTHIPTSPDPHVTHPRHPNNNTQHTTAPKQENHPIFPFLDQQIATLTHTLSSPTPAYLGSGDIYSHVISNFGPLGTLPTILSPLHRLLSLPLHFLNFFFPHFHHNPSIASTASPNGSVDILLNLLVATRDRRIPRATKEECVYDYWGHETLVDAQGRPRVFTVREVARMRDGDGDGRGEGRYLSRTAEGFMRRRGVFGW